MTALPLAGIRQDGGCQPRATIDLAVVSDYAEAMAQGAAFPPVTVFYDGETYWLADGYHRIAAAEGAGRREIEADIRQGTRRDAVLFSVGANAAHGLRRTNEDKRRAVLTLLNDPEWSHWSDAEIARRCAVSPMTVSRHRPQPIINNVKDTRTVTRNGSTYTMQTAGIGRRPAAPPPRAEDRPVFDGTPIGMAEERPMPEPPRTADGRIVVNGRELEERAGRWDSSGADIYHALKDMLRARERLPATPDAANAGCNRDLAHNIRAADLADLAAFLTRLAQLWAASEPERDARVAAMVERANEMEKTHVFTTR